MVNTEEIEAFVDRAFSVILTNSRTSSSSVLNDRTTLSFYSYESFGSYYCITFDEKVPSSVIDTNLFRLRIDMDKNEDGSYPLKSLVINKSSSPYFDTLLNRVLALIKYPWEYVKKDSGYYMFKKVKRIDKNTNDGIAEDTSTSNSSMSSETVGQESSSLTFNTPESVWSTLENVWTRDGNR